MRKKYETSKTTIYISSDLTEIVNENKQPTIEEEILFEAKYQTMLLEMGGM